MQTQATIKNRFINTITHGDCIQVMRQMPANSVDFILTDPPYLVNYKDRTGRSIKNDSNSDWLIPAMREAYRVLKQDRVAVMFYGWSAVNKFFAAWRQAGFYPVGHIVFRKDYASKSRLVRYQHEQAYLLAKGKPRLPKTPIADIIDIDYGGNNLHSTQKPLSVLVPLISAVWCCRLIRAPLAASTCCSSTRTTRSATEFSSRNSRVPTGSIWLGTCPRPCCPADRLVRKWLLLQQSQVHAIVLYGLSR